jgi:hypothetical protein
MRGSKPGTLPCGTPAAMQRHRRRGEPPCPACVQAERERRARTRPMTARTPDWRPARNGLPEFVPYVYQGTGEDQLTPWM